MNDVSLDEDYEFNLKIRISGMFKQFPTTYKTKLSQALKTINSELGRRGKTLIVISRDGDQIPLDESPQSLGLTPGSILDAFEATDTTTEVLTIDADDITVKLQDGHRKHLKEYTCDKSEPVLELKKQYAKDFDIDIASMKLSFDGDIIDDNATLEELDIDDGCVIDVIVCRAP